MMNVLVTGGAGFVGSHVVEYYAENGTDVTALDNLSRTETLETADESRDTGAYNWQYLEENYPGVELVEGDIRDEELMEELVEGHDAVVHTAGQVAVTASIQDPRTDFEVNAEGTFNVLEAARKADSDPGVVIASTNKVYGDNVNDVPVREAETRYWYDDPEYDAGIPESLSIEEMVQTVGSAATLTIGMSRDDPDLVGRGMDETVVTPARADLIPGYDRAVEAACEAGATGATVSGAGPAILAVSHQGDQRDRDDQPDEIGERGQGEPLWQHHAPHPGALGRKVCDTRECDW